MKKRIAHVTLAVLLTLSSVSLAGCKKETPTGVVGTVGQKQTVEIKALVKVDYPTFRKSIAEGQTVKFRESGATIGQIRSITETPSLVGVATYAGSLVMTTSPNLRDINLTIVGEAKLTETGYTFGGNHMYVNQTVKMLAPYAQFDPLILSIQEVKS